MSSVLHQLTDRVAGLSTKVTALLFAAMILASTIGMSAALAPQKASANPSGHINWQVVYQKVEAGGTIAIVGCKTYHPVSAFGPFYTMKLWLFNTTDHHRRWSWEQLRPVPPENRHWNMIYSDSSMQWENNMLRRDIQISAYYNDFMMVRFYDEPFDPANPVLPLGAFVHPSQLNDC